MWEKAGVVRNGPDLDTAICRLRELRERAQNARAAGEAASNPAWNESMNLLNLCVVGEMVARCGSIRTESRGAHYRLDCPESDPAWLKNIFLQRAGDAMEIATRPVEFTRITPPEVEMSMHADSVRHN